jgi:RimJ/RimL family protein N-acetyltransferase
MTVERTQLTTARLLLRPFTFRDVADVVAYANDPEYGRFLPLLPRPYTEHDGEEFVAQAILRDWSSFGPQFAITLEGRAIGGLNLRLRQPEGSAEMGYAIARPFWGQGLTAEAARAVIDWAFPAYDLAKVFAYANVENSQSRRVMEKLGMQHEATLRRHMLGPSGRADSVLYGLLRDEWEARPR